MPPANTARNVPPGSWKKVLHDPELAVRLGCEAAGHAAVLAVGDVGVVAVGGGVGGGRGMGGGGEAGGGGGGAAGGCVGAAPGRQTWPTKLGTHCVLGLQSERLLQPPQRPPMQRPNGHCASLSVAQKKPNA